MDRNTIHRFFEGNCTKEEVQEVRAWMDASSENKEEFFREAQLFDAIDLLASENVESGYSSESRVKPIFKEFLKIAATIAIALSVAGGWQYYIERDTQQAMNIISAPAGKNASVILPDGTKAWLNARTTIQYPSAFERYKREIILDGEAYFEVSPNKKKPFIVRTKDYNVEVLGTKFNVEAYSFKKETITSLMEGSVKLTSAKDPNHTMLLEPHNMAYLENGSFVIQKITNYNRYRWRDGLICFDDVSFPEIMREFEKYYEVHVIIENKKVSSYLCTGKFRQSDGIDYALKVLQKDAQFKFERVEDTNIIYIK